ncbi:MAG: hypothetical protein JWQ34_1680 [Mucilaginibacter sp.]|nr:hypothetical protein [Mucilaginibacter sp.]
MYYHSQARDLMIAITRHEPTNEIGIGDACDASLQRLFCRDTLHVSPLLQPRDGEVEDIS